MTSPSLDDGPLSSPQLLQHDDSPRPLPRVRHSFQDNATTQLPLRESRPVIAQRSSTNTSVTPSGTKRQASAPVSQESLPISHVIQRAFAAHVSVLSSPDCDEIIRHKGINGGLLELLRPYGETVTGRVVIRDSIGASKPWDNFGIRFVGVNDGLEPPRPKLDTNDRADPAIANIDEYRPARLRSGGDLGQIDQIVEAHMDHIEAELRFVQQREEDPPTQTQDARLTGAGRRATYMLYLRRLLSGTVTSPHETFAHPVTQVIAISSRNPAPIDELRNLYTSGKTGPDRPPVWINNDFLRYYVLVHDEDYDDIKKSTALYEQMKRHFGLHCHLLRLRSTQCVPTDDGSVVLPTPEWTSAAEDLADVTIKESMDDVVNEDQRPCIFESDVAAVQSFVREMVAQSIVPVMERMVATWNDQVASRRRGLSGRFMSLSKRFTPFVGGRISPAPGGAATGGGNYDSAAGSYRPEAPESIMRKLADYAFMLRDYKLAQSTYEIITQDYKSDKAWKHFAGSSEMTALTMLLQTSTQQPATKIRNDSLNQILENAYYSYATRCAAPYQAVRASLLAAELLRTNAFPSGQRARDETAAAKWLCRVLDDRLTGPAGHALLTERIADCYGGNTDTKTSRSGMTKLHKAAFWSVLAASAYLDLDKQIHAKTCLSDAWEYYARLEQRSRPLVFRHARAYLGSDLDRKQVTNDADGLGLDRGTSSEPVQLQADTETRRRARSISTASATLMAGPGDDATSQVSSSQTRKQGKDAGSDSVHILGRTSPEPDDDGFV